MPDCTEARGIPLICVACEGRTERTEEEMHGECPHCGATAMVRLVGRDQ